MNINKKRVLLIIIPFGCLPIFLVQTCRTIVYVSCYTFSASVIFLFNFPYFIQCLHLKPIYFEDLIINENIEPMIKTKFQDIFTRILNVLLAIALTILVNYGLYRLQDSTLSYFELLGILGGIISLYRTIWDYIGKLVLKILMIKKHFFIINSPLMAPQVAQSSSMIPLN